MPAGEYRDTFDFLRSTTSHNEYNQAQKKSWAIAFTLWCKVMEEGGREFISAQKTNKETTMLIKIRNTEKVKKDMKVRRYGKTYDILHISDPKEKKTARYISLKEVT